MSRRAGVPTPAQRRAQVAKLAATHTRRELAALLDVSPRTIGNDLHALNLTAKRGQMGRPSWAVTLARRERVRELSPTHTVREMAALLHVSEWTIRHDLRALGIDAVPGERGHKFQLGDPDEPQAQPARVGPRPQARWCPIHPGVRIGAWGCRACNAQRNTDAAWCAWMMRSHP